MESLPLKVLDFGLQMPTGPSSGVVAGILLVSSRLDCPGISLAEVCATCLEMSMWSFSGGCCSSNFFFINFNQYKAKQIKLIVSQAFFLGKPMRDAAFFFFFCKPQPQLVSDQKPQASHKGIKLTHAGSFLFMLEAF